LRVVNKECLLKGATRSIIGLGSFDHNFWCGNVSFARIFSGQPVGFRIFSSRKIIILDSQGMEVSIDIHFYIFIFLNLGDYRKSLNENKIMLSLLKEALFRALS